MHDDAGIETLLDLNGQIIDQGDGVWIKIDAWRVVTSADIPHGVRYSLTLHDQHNTRVLGFDNAHAIKPERKKYGCRKITWDHKHQREKIAPYEYESAGQLLEDFWTAVEQVINEKE